MKKIYILIIPCLVIIFNPLILAQVKQNPINESYEIKEQKIYVINFINLTLEQEKFLLEEKIIGKGGIQEKLEITENEKSKLDQAQIKYEIVEQGIQISNEDYIPSIHPIENPLSIEETSKSGNNTTDYIIPDLGTAYSPITITGAISGSIATRIVYTWNIDHDYITDVTIRCGTSNWNDGYQWLSATGDDWLDGYNQTSEGTRTSYPTNQSVNQEWVLVATDNYVSDAGRIDSWTITVYYTADPPIFTTNNASNIGTTFATLNGAVNPGGLITSYWFEYGTSTSYGTTTTTRQVSAGTSVVTVSGENISGLAPNTLYHFRIRGTNNAGSTTGSDRTFTTSPIPKPTVTTNSASLITSRSVRLNGTVNPNGYSTTYYFQYGKTTSYGSITSSTSAGSGTSNVSVTANVDYLEAGTVYHYRIVATNAGGTSYGNDVSFTTTALTINMTAPSSNITVAQGSNVTLTWSGSPSSNTSVAVLRDNDNIWENGSGETWIALSQPVSGTYNWNTTGVPLGTYYIAAMITDGSSQNHDYANATVTVTGPKPTVTTNSASLITSRSVRLNGTVNPNGYSTTYYFQYGKTTSYGSITSSTSAGSGTSNVSVTANVDYLEAGTVYHYRIVATNAGGTSYGNDVSFTTTALTINMTAPSSNITVAQGSNVTLTWSGSPSSNTSVAVLRDNDNIWENGSGETWIALSQPVSGTYNWNTTGVPLGTYYIAAMITDGSSQNHDYANATVTILDLPDLVVGDPNGPSTAAPGEQIDISCTVNNNGPGSSGLNRVGYYLATTQYGQDIFLGYDTVDPLSVGYGSIETATVTIPSNTVPGQPYWITYFADYEDVVDETNENNNINSYQINIQNSYTINLTQPSSNITVTQGDNVNLQWTGSPSEGMVSLRRDADNVWDNGNENWIELLLPSSGSYSWNTTGVPLGTYYIAAMITVGGDYEYDYAPGRVTITPIPTYTISGTAKSSLNSFDIIPNATISLDGQNVATTGSDGSYSITNIEIGSHTINISHPAYYQWQDGGTYTINVTQNTDQDFYGQCMANAEVTYVVPSSFTPGVPFDITVNIKNTNFAIDGVPAYLDVSFPYYTEQTFPVEFISQSGFNASPQFYPASSLITRLNTLTGQWESNYPAEYLLVSAVRTQTIYNQQTWSFTLRITPSSPETISLNIKGSIGDKRDPSSGTVGQQGLWEMELIIPNGTSGLYDQVWKVIKDDNLDLNKIHLLSNSLITNLNRQLTETIDDENLRYIYFEDKNGATVYNYNVIDWLFENQSIEKYKDWPTMNYTTALQLDDAELVNRDPWLFPQYDVYNMVPYAIQEWWADLFIYAKLDQPTIRKDRFKTVFLDAILQPDLNDDDTQDGEARKQLQQMINVMSLPSQLKNVGQAVIYGSNIVGNGLLFPGRDLIEFNTYLLDGKIPSDAASGFLTKFNQNVLAPLNLVLVPVKFYADAIDKLYIQCLVTFPNAERRLKALEYFITQNSSTLDPEMVNGFLEAKNEFYQMVDEYYSEEGLMQALWDAAKEDPVESGVRLLSLSSSLATILGSTTFGTVLLPYVLSWEVYKGIREQINTAQEACIAATLFRSFHTKNIFDDLKGKVDTQILETKYAEYTLDLININYYLSWYFYNKTLRVTNNTLTSLLGDARDFIGLSDYSNFIEYLQGRRDDNYKLTTVTSAPFYLARHSNGFDYNAQDYESSFLLSKIISEIPSDPLPNDIVASFAATPLSGYTPLMVNFVDNSNGNDINTWLWEFGDGITSNIQNPSHTYTQPGAFSVNLTASNTTISDVSDRKIILANSLEPTANFSASIISGTIPLEVNFNNLSQDAYSFTWSFGDGGFSTMTNPTHIYEYPGNYTVSLIAYGFSNQDVEIKVDYITVEGPKGNLVVNTNLETASYVITGPKTLTGGAFTKTFSQIPIGQYQIEFYPASGYSTPPIQNFEVITNQTTTITGSYSGSIPILSWSGNVGFETDGVDPEEGNTSTTYAFKVKYSDADGDAPLTGFPKVHIKKAGVEITDSPFTLSEANSDPFITGRIYTFDKSNLEIGTDYTYYFEAYDVNSNQASGDATVEQNGPVVNEILPQIQVTFNVNLSVLIQGGLFNPNTDAVYLRGLLNDWLSFENPMTDQDNDGVYILTLPLEQNSYYEYKFWINTLGAPNYGWEGKVGTGSSYGNRTLNTEISDIDIPTVYFSDLTTLPQIDDAVLCYSDQNYKGKPDVSPFGDQLTFYYSSLPDLYGDRHPVLCDIANDFTVSSITEMTNNTYGTFMDWEPVFRKPDGNEIYFITDRYTYWDLYKYDKLNLTENFVFRWGAYYEIHNLRFSPDGDKFVCHSNIPGGQFLTIFNSDGSNPQYFENGYYPDWSSDGNNIVFVRSDSIFVLNIISNEVQYLYSNEKYIYSPKWSPSGNSIVFSTMITNSFDVWTINSDGSNPQQITTSIWDDLDPVWDGVNNRIYFVSSRSSQYSNIYSIPVESTPTTVDFAINLSVTDNCTNSTILQLGTAADATDGYDSQYDLFAPPSPPFSDIFDGRLRLNSEDYLKDFRATNSNGVVVWNVIYQPEGGCSPITLSWNPTDLPEEGFFTLVDGITGGSLASVDMRSINSYTDNMGLGNLQIIFKYTKAMTNTVASGWNMLSLPIIVGDANYQTLFPNATTGTLYGFNSAYYSTDVFETAQEGYWLRFPAAETVTLEGEPVDNTSINLNAGWNIIGSVFCDVALSTVSDPGGIIIPGTLYGFNGAYYSASSITKGKAFWLRTSSAGTITLDCQTQTLPKANSQNLASMNETDLSDFSKIEIKDGNEITNTLYFSGKLAEGVDKESYSLPPIAPAGAFDVRLNGGYRLVESEEVGVNIQSSKYPVRITIDGNGKLSSTEGYIIKELSGGIEVASEMVKDKQELVINDSRVKMITIQKGQIVPAEYSLAQNYPNPFNPSTTIKFGLPEATRVKVSIYSMLGELITELLDTDMEAGYHRVEFNASGIASGVYLYRIETQKFNNVKKMIILK